MNISKEEASEALGQIDDAISQTRRTIGQGNSSTKLILWGVIWMIGYSCSQFVPAKAQTIWLCLVGLGTLGSLNWGARSKPHPQSPNGSRIGSGWLVLFAYAVFWFFLFHLDNQSGRLRLHFEPSSGLQSGVFFATVAMCAYVLAGLWLGRFFIWLGATVTLLTVVGYFLMPDWFCVWMAITGGGSLIVAGLYIRRFWRQAHGAA
jgi:hypothetical protein